MRREPKKYCNGCQREAICCGPEDPADIVVFRFVIVGDEQVVMRWDHIEDCVLLEACGHVVYIVHGYHETFQLSADYYDKIRDGWYNRGSCVIMVDWSKGNHHNYFQSIANVRSVGAAIGFNIKQCGKSDRTLVVGHSLGGQIIGEAGKFFTNVTQGAKIPLCHALDPAGPFYDDCSKDVRLNADDCKEVHVCHSDAQEESHTPAGATGYGSNIKCGLCDYWINCGYEQRKNPCDGMSTADYYAGSEKGGPEFAERAGAHERTYNHVICPHAYGNQLRDPCLKGIPCPGCPDKNCPPLDERDQVPTTPLMIDYDCTAPADFLVRANTSDVNGDFCVNNNKKAINVIEKFAETRN
ncbi:Pancreatic lipase-related protein 2 [Halotydeus destructor]|nr:Pancreatic lipase-related protein 2 [Halotydeus destructor]